MEACPAFCTKAVAGTLIQGEGGGRQVVGAGQVVGAAVAVGAGQVGTAVVVVGSALVGAGQVVVAMMAVRMQRLSSGIYTQWTGESYNTTHFNSNKQVWAFQKCPRTSGANSSFAPKVPFNIF